MRTHSIEEQMHTVNNNLWLCYYKCTNGFRSYQKRTTPNIKWPGLLGLLTSDCIRYHYKWQRMIRPRRKECLLFYSDLCGHVVVLHTQVHLTTYKYDLQYTANSSPLWFEKYICEWIMKRGSGVGSSGSGEILYIGRYLLIVSKEFNPKLHTLTLGDSILVLESALFPISLWRYCHIFIFFPNACIVTYIHLIDFSAVFKEATKMFSFYDVFYDL